MGVHVMSDQVRGNVYGARSGQEEIALAVASRFILTELTSVDAEKNSWLPGILQQFLQSPIDKAIYGTRFEFVPALQPTDRPQEAGMFLPKVGTG